MNTQKIISTSIEKEGGIVVEIRQCSQPEDKTKWIYQALNYKEIPVPKKKFVWHTEPIEKIRSLDNQFCNDA